MDNTFSIIELIDILKVHYDDVTNLVDNQIYLGHMTYLGEVLEESQYLVDDLLLLFLMFPR